jgi:membrane protein
MIEASEIERQRFNAAEGRVTMFVAVRLDGYQRRHPRAGFPLAVVYRFFDDSGTNLAALMTYYGFLSLFPLLLLTTTILGIVLTGDPHAQQTVLKSALGQFPIIGDQLKARALGGGAGGIIIGGLGALYGSLGIAQAVQNAMNTAWAVPKNSRPNPLKARGVSLLLLATAGVTVIATTVLSSLGAGAGHIAGQAGPGVRLLVHVLLIAASVALNAAAFIAAFRIAPARRLTTRQVAPGAISAAIVWQLLQSFGASYVQHVVRHASATNAVFALVLGLIAFIYLAALGMVLSVEINVVRVDQLYPRALLTPFTDNVDLTEGDEQAYADQAKAQRSKGFEHVDVTFER